MSIKIKPCLPAGCRVTVRIYPAHIPVCRRAGNMIEYKNKALPPGRV
nr:MAG TPA: hypothetical protein [Caudoviricetes sp.]